MRKLAIIPALAVALGAMSTVAPSPAQAVREFAQHLGFTVSDEAFVATHKIELGIKTPKPKKATPAAVIEVWSVRNRSFMSTATARDCSKVCSIASISSSQFRFAVVSTVPMR